MSSGIKDEYHEQISKDMGFVNGRHDYDSRIMQEDGLPFALGIDNEAEIEFNRKNI